ncbi:hypothetical protein HII36_29725 [Nonomuraea sp. NN258]|uniref:hypothetical protein n=1 Tax=Nonomuraea antri TaxID=2730852 RepID=UPI00156A49F0|nr:hypothetical protein [Nonomuraea antri]NRQ35981.1 hypothetical protein [Nonomuraea antri]
MSDVDFEAEDRPEFESWDAFWDETLRAEAAERGQQPTEVIRGVTVRVPQDLPLSFEFKAKKLKNSDSEQDFAALLANLFGTDVLDAWVSNGMGGKEFKVVLAWGLSHGKGKPITFREAYDSVMAAESDDADDAEDEGKDSPQRNAASGSTGARSRRTSTASTGSSRRASRR